MDPYAQTNIQLYEQLCRQGYSPAAIGKVAEAYSICPSLFSCLYRPSGKTFIAHLVGTASILASLSVSVDIVIAGLLHAAYAHGDFGTGVYNVSAAKQRRLRRIVGAEAEEYIRRYTALLWWNDENIRGVHRRMNDFDSIDRDVLLIRLANELEELLDYGWLHWSTIERRKEYRDGTGRIVVEMAERIGYPTLARQLDLYLNRSASSEIPQEIRDNILAGAASDMVPSRVMELKRVPYLRRWLTKQLHELQNSRIAHPKLLYWKLCSFMRHSLEKL